MIPNGPTLKVNLRATDHIFLCFYPILTTWWFYHQTTSSIWVGSLVWSTGHVLKPIILRSKMLGRSCGKAMFLGIFRWENNTSILDQLPEGTQPSGWVLHSMVGGFWRRTFANQAAWVQWRVRKRIRRLHVFLPRFCLRNHVCVSENCEIENFSGMEKLDQICLNRICIHLPDLELFCWATCTKRWEAVYKPKLVHSFELISRVDWDSANHRDIDVHTWYRDVISRLMSAQSNFRRGKLFTLNQASRISCFHCH